MIHEALTDGPPPELRFRRRTGPISALAELWRARELVRTLAERELRVRYKQALLGLAWVFVTPTVMLIVFSVLFQRIANVDTGGAPYPQFAYLGLFTWTFFSTSVSAGGTVLLSNQTLLNKVYCPREVFPLAAVIVAGVDALISTALFGVLLVVNRHVPGPTAAWSPVLLGIQLAFTLGVTLLISSMVVYLRDLRHALPIALQFGLFATPVAYGLDAVPASLRTPYVVLNPLAAAIDGYRRTLLLGLPPDWGLTIPAAVSALAVLFLGFVVFKRLETGFADVT